MMRFQDDFKKIPILDKYEVFECDDENLCDPDEIIDLRNLGRQQKSDSKANSIIKTLCLGLFASVYVFTVVVILVYSVINQNNDMLWRLFKVMHWSFTVVILGFVCSKGKGGLKKLWRKLMERIFTG